MSSCQPLTIRPAGRQSKKGDASACPNFHISFSRLFTRHFLLHSHGECNCPHSPLTISGFCRRSRLYPLSVHDWSLILTTAYLAPHIYQLYQSVHPHCRSLQSTLPLTSGYCHLFTTTKPEGNASLPLVTHNTVHSVSA